MDFPNDAVIIGVNLRDIQKAPSSQHIFADVVLIDKSHATLEPLLYQVNKETLKESEQASNLHQHSFLPIKRDAFMMVGQVIMIDKKKKQIHLKNQRTVSYNHLILATGLSQSPLGTIHDEEFAAGLQALMEALRVRKNLPVQFATPHMNALAKKYALPEDLHLTMSDGCDVLKGIGKILTTKSDRPTLSIRGDDKRLYEVQL